MKKIKILNNPKNSNKEYIYVTIPIYIKDNIFSESCKSIKIMIHSSS